ncbi:MAG: hypothetical protein Q7K57_15390 [Burkholderiaceae bacterium]|nr:hypothetical protein [Burkholderiaceae bacterium]
MRLSIPIVAALVATLTVTGAGLAQAQVGDALRRPALAVKEPQRAVLLAAAQAGSRTVAVGERGIVALSDDRGASWRQAPCPVSVTLTMVRFADDKHGVAVGHGGTVLTTEDAGTTWRLRLDGRRLAELAKAAAVTPRAQQEAERLLADGPDKPLLDVLQWDAKRLLAVGAYGLALYSADGGETWTPWMDRLPNPKSLHWYVARRAGDALLLAGEQGLLARSDDGGQTFQGMSSPYKGSWFAGDIRADGQTVLAGLRGNVWRSVDGGAQWVQLASPVPSTITAMAVASGGELLLASQAGVVLRLQGDVLVPLKAPPVPMPSALLPLQGGPLLALGVAGVVVVETKEALQ